MLTHRPALLLLLLAMPVCTTCARAQPPVKPQKPDPAREKAREMLRGYLTKEKITVDFDRRTLSIPVVVNRARNDLEYLLIYPTGKKHEALLITESKPSVIKAGLQAIGMVPGKNADFKKKDPMPSEAEIAKGAEPYDFVPPSGQEMWMTVSFTDKATKKKVELPIEELLLDWAENLSVTGNSWIYLGGRMAQLYRGEAPVFMADYEGNLISTIYRYPNNHLFTIHHARGRDETNWAMTPKCPPPGTEMTLTFHAVKPPIVAAREARMAREAAERKKKGIRVDLSSRPERNPARPDSGGEDPPPKKKDEQGAGTTGGKREEGKAKGAASRPASRG